MKELLKLNIDQVRSKLLNKEISATELCQANFDHIEQVDKEINALLALRKEEALKEAKELDKQGPNPNQLLWGIPITVKDAICLKGIPTTSASKVLENFIPNYDAFVVEKLRQAGAILLGKNNMDEFAMGSTTQSSAYKITRNPHDLSRVPGGSSGGSAAAVAAYESYASLGTDTGGSIRQPAALCGCYGIKPSYGRVSRYGVIAYASSLDQVGPLARSAADCAVVLEAISGFDPQDSTSAQLPVPNYLEALSKRTDLKGMKIGVPKEFFTPDLDPESLKLYNEIFATIKSQGAELVELSFKLVDSAVATYYIIATAEASSNLARFDGVRYGHRSENFTKLDELYCNSRSEAFGAEVQRRILLGTFVLSAGYYDAYYKKAAQVRRLVRDEYDQAFAKCDVIIAPVSPKPAWKIGTKMSTLESYYVDTYTLSANLAGLPAMSFPVGKNSDNLPIGMQIIGRAFDESNVLAVCNILGK